MYVTKLSLGCKELAKETDGLHILASVHLVGLTGSRLARGLSGSALQGLDLAGQEASTRVALLLGEVASVTVAHGARSLATRSFASGHF